MQFCKSHEYKLLPKSFLFSLTSLSASKLKTHRHHFRSVCAFWGVSVPQCMSLLYKLSLFYVHCYCHIKFFKLEWNKPNTSYKCLKIS